MYDHETGNGMIGSRVYEDGILVRDIAVPDRRLLITHPLVFYPIKLWLDDERNPEDPITQQKFGSNGDEIWVKTVEEAKKYILQGKVVSISFDHDLGTELTGYDLAKWIEERAFDKSLKLIPIMRVHSQNVIGAKNILTSISKCYEYWTNN